VEGFGGVPAVLDKLTTALEQEQYAWAVQLGRWLYRTEPLNQDVVKLYADALRELGRRTSAWTSRNFYLSEARIIEGEAEPLGAAKPVDPEKAPETVLLNTSRNLPIIRMWK
jgi:alkyl sulfatase BDS1-like metallo-beta-lactamase superfamily hydrolase